MARLFLTLSFVFTALEFLGVGPWVNPRKSYYFQVNYTFLGYNNAFNSDGVVAGLRGDVTDLTYAAYGEYSFHDKSMLSITLPMKQVSFGGRTLSGLGDITIGGKTQLLDSPLPFALYYNLNLPTARTRGNLRTGYRAAGLELGLSTGYGTDNYYGQLSVGYAYRDGIPDQFRLDLEIARKLSIGKVNAFIAFNLNGAFNTSNLDRTEFNEPLFNATVLYHPNGDYLSPGIKLMVNPIGGWWINLSGYGAISARHQGAAPTINLGISYKKS